MKILKTMEDINGEFWWDVSSENPAAEELFSFKTDPLMMD